MPNRRIAVFHHPPMSSFVGSPFLWRNWFFDSRTYRSLNSLFSVNQRLKDHRDRCDRLTANRAKTGSFLHAFGLMVTSISKKYY